MNALDENLQKVCPTLMVPRYEAIADMVGNGHRYLLADSGLWIEAKRSWLHARLPVCALPVPMPYGSLTEKVAFVFNSDFVTHLRRFAWEAAAAFPNEHAAWFEWDELHGKLEYVAVEILEQNGSRVHYDRPAYRPKISPCVDIHSHGIHPAGFSPDDDIDDGETKLAVCFGNCDRDTPTVAARLCLQGQFYDFSDWLVRLLYNLTIPTNARASNDTPASC